MKIRSASKQSAFALVVTLVLMGLVVTIVVAYLLNTRSDRSASSSYANRLRAKMIADSGLAAGTRLLYNNTKYGNYITAMPAPAAASASTPSPAYTEIYRPTDSADTTTAKANDFLQLSNAAGEALVSLSSASSASPAPQVDARPAPPMIPPGGPFGINPPTMSGADSYDFNQVVRIAGNDAARLITSKTPVQPAYGQWLRVRDASGEVIGRYAFFIEDESMKVNLNTIGNALATGANLRVNDYTLPLPTPAPATQIEELDPAAILDTAANRAAADAALTAVGPSGNRVSTTSTIALINQWNSNFPVYGQLATVVSRDDDTTAKGWQRLDLNSVVAGATDNASKVAAAIRIANWIRDAWTGPALSGLQPYQMFNDDRVRKQIAANIVDYIDSDDIPTDMGDIVPDGYPDAVPVIGIEKLPYLVAVEIIYQASNSNGSSSATLRTKVQFRFLNLFETDLDLANSVGRIELQGVPVLSRNGTTVFDVSSKQYKIAMSSLKPVHGTDTKVPAGIDGSSDSGARTFTTDWLETQTVTFNGAANIKPVLLAGKITVKVFGVNNERLDDTAIVTNLTSTGYKAPASGNNSTGDFLKDATAANGPLQIASIGLVYSVPAGTTSSIDTFDPRFRPPIVNDRWYTISRTDASQPAGTNRIDAFIDKAELLNRIYAFDWYDSVGDRPLAFQRNGPLRSVGELGNVATCEYPWRTIYLQYPERPGTTTQVGPATEVPLRRKASVDYILMDLFRTKSSQPRIGAININTQQRAATQQHALAPLFSGMLVGTQPSITQPMLDRFCETTGSNTVSPIFDRRVAAGPPPDNSPTRPFFQIGELASVISRLVNTSVNSTTSSRTTVSYSALRNDPSSPNEANLNFRTDGLAEQEFRELSNSITTRGNAFRILYVGQSVKDVNKDGSVEPSEVQAEYLGEAFVERTGTFTTDSANADLTRTSDSAYKVLMNRAITE